MSPLLPMQQQQQQSTLGSFFRPMTCASEAAQTTTTKVPPEACIRPMTTSDIGPLRRINSLLLQVRYPDTFYDTAASSPLSRVIEYTHAGTNDGKVVGGIVCRLDDKTLYMRSLCVLAPYRSLGLATAALDSVLVEAARLGATEVTAHVWTQNDDALRWYEARGFRRDKDPVQGYYFKLRPDTAWLMRREVSQSRRPPPPATGRSYQTVRPDGEWNDLPSDMAPPVRKSGSESAASSRSSSAAPRRKRDRSYPAAAFGA